MTNRLHENVQNSSANCAGDMTKLVGCYTSKSPNLTSTSKEFWKQFLTKMTQMI